jgi:hypothetical protein
MSDDPFDGGNNSAESSFRKALTKLVHQTRALADDVERVGNTVYVRVQVRRLIDLSGAEGQVTALYTNLRLKLQAKGVTGRSNNMLRFEHYMTGIQHSLFALAGDDDDDLTDIVRTLRGAALGLSEMFLSKPAKAGAGAVAPTKDQAAHSSAPNAFYSPTEIAKAMSAPAKADAIRKALARLFEENRLADESWMENNNPAKGQAKIMYKLSAVRPFLSRFERSANG